MSGRLEKEIMFENKTKKKLENAPKVLTEYYYSLISASKSYKTAYDYICYIISFLDFTFKEKCNDNFYLKVKPIHVNRYISSLRTKNINGKTERTSDSLKTVHWSALNSFFQFLMHLQYYNKQDRYLLNQRKFLIYLHKLNQQRRHPFL